MTTAKKGASVKAGKSGGGRQSPPSGARAERKRKNTSRAKGDASRQSIPKVGKSDVGTGKRGGPLH